MGRDAAEDALAAWYIDLEILHDSDGPTGCRWLLLNDANVYLLKTMFTQYKSFGNATICRQNGQSSCIRTIASVMWNVYVHVR